MSFEKSIWKRGLAFCAGVVLGSALAGFCQTAPPNDNFTNAAALTGTSITFTGTLVGASFESIETNSTPPFVGGPQTGGSVWWTWTAPQSSTVVIELVRDYSIPTGYTEFDVFSGMTLNALTWEGENSFDKPFARYVAFTASAGMSYQFRMAGPLNQPFSLKLTATNAPVFVVQPKDTVVSPCQSAFFYARAAQFPAASYQWKFNGVPIPHQTAPSLVVYNPTTNAVGSYSVVASNATGITESAPAMLTLADTNPVPRLVGVSPAGAGLMSLSLTGEVGRLYRVESSQDLINWGNMVRFRLTNATQLISVPSLGPVHFVRASLDASTDACIAQLEQMNWAVALYRSENRLPPTAPYELQDLLPYVPKTEIGTLVPCPAGGRYVSGATVTNPVPCNVTRHVVGVDELWALGF
jgi:hypothetical protein